MALIVCIDCGNQISDRALSCPRCGAPSEPPATRAPAPAQAGAGTRELEGQGSDFSSLEFNQPQRARAAQEGSDRVGLVLKTKFGLILALFLLPFVNISCSELIDIDVTGWQLVTGTTLEWQALMGEEVVRETLEPQALAGAAFFVALVGLGAAFVATRGARITGALCGAAGGICLLLLKTNIDKEVLKSGGGLLSVQYGIGLWLVLLLFAAAIAVGIYGASLTPASHGARRGA